VWEAFRAGKIASLIGMEGTHLLGNSLGALRIFAQLGVRYLTLTHTCHSAFASSAGPGTPIDQVHEGDGLSALGEELIKELNRVGILVDLSHTTVATMRQAIALSEAPVVWTHAGARALWDHPRNVPDDILKLIGDGPGQKDGVIQSIFFPTFIGPYPGANVTHVADHIEHIASKVGRNRVGIASDFDGMYLTVDGLEDATKYPNIVSLSRSLFLPLSSIEFPTRTPTQGLYLHLHLLGRRALEPRVDGRRDARGHGRQSDADHGQSGRGQRAIEERPIAVLCNLGETDRPPLDKVGRWRPARLLAHRRQGCRGEDVSAP
jgi:hypothetical protein